MPVLCLFAFVASAHALIAGLAAVAVAARLHLDAGQGTIILIVAVVMAAGYSAAYAGVCIFAAHGFHLVKTYLPFPANTFCPAVPRFILRNKSGGILPR